MRFVNRTKANTALIETALTGESLYTKKNNMDVILKMKQKKYLPVLSFSVSKGYYIGTRKAGIQQLSEGFVSFDHESANQIRLRQRT